jgi:hypothetical protein
MEGVYQKCYVHKLFHTLINPKTLTVVGGNIKINLKETGWGGMDWIHLAQDRDQWWALVNTVMNLRVP